MPVSTESRGAAGPRLVIPALIAGWAAAFAGAADPAPPRGMPIANGKTTAARPAEVQAVRPVYRQRCQRCHDEDGRGGGSDAPDFTDAKWQKGRSDVQLLVSILDGTGSMPGFRGKISDEQARGLVALIRSFATGNGGGADDFASRFRRLQEELDELQRQFRELNGAAKQAEGRGTAAKR